VTQSQSDTLEPESFVGEMPKLIRCPPQNILRDEVENYPKRKKYRISKDDSF
jgi:hypothetical protein